MSVGERGYTEGIHQAIAPNETLCTTMVVSDIHRRTLPSPLQVSLPYLHGIFLYIPTLIVINSRYIQA